MSPSDVDFQKSIRRQIALNRSRTPTERFLALCDLLEAARQMAPMDPASCERRRRVEAARQKERERWHAEYKQFIAAHQSGAAPRV